MQIIGLVVTGHRELRWYGREITESQKEALLAEYGTVEAVDILDLCQDVFAGLQVDDPTNPGASGLQISYFYPDEEDEAGIGPDREIDISRVEVAVRRPGRKRVAPGRSYLCGGDYRAGYRETRHYLTDCLPPVQPRDFKLILDDLRDFGSSGYVLAEVFFQGRQSDHLETSPLPGIKLPSRILEDHSPGNDPD